MRLIALLLISVALLGAIATSTPLPTHAESIDEIKDRIDEINRERAKIDEEIAGYQRELNVISGQKQTLQSAIQTLDVSRSKTSAQIKEIQNKIGAATLRLEELSFEITDKEQSIALDQSTVAASLRAIDIADQVSFVERLVGADDFAAAWTSIDNLATLNQSLQEHAALLAGAKIALAEQQTSVSSTKNELASHSVNLESQKQALDINRQGKQTLLSQTQATESQYQAMIAEKRRQQAAFEAQLFTYEAQLKQALDPSSIPSAGSGVLASPLDSVFVTQYFGRTVDAKRLYVSGTHGGIDYRATIGTPIKASLTGVVTDVESTKTKSGCQYGKWVLLKHANGLSTLYGHLSSVNVSPGQTVSTGDPIGHSGDTGYATGPHLHFGVYATSGIRIVDASALGSTYCAGIKTVASNPDAYLDPMSYL